MDNFRHAYFETTLDCWEDIFKIPQRFMDKFVFRGQGSYKWDLSNSLERSVKRYYPNNVDSLLSLSEERSIIKEFKWKYPLYSKSQPLAYELVEWLTIMQHHGAPTRLLDITKSLFIAVYFALSEHLQEDSAVWAINGIVFRANVLARYRSLNQVVVVGQDALTEFTHKSANQILHNRSKHDEWASIFYIEPKIINERISRQQGAFLMPANIETSFANNLAGHISNNDPIIIDFKELIKYSVLEKYKQDDITLMKIVIPKELNFEIGKYLRAMNITAEMLFPGLDGLCKSLSYLRMEGMGNSFKP